MSALAQLDKDVRTSLLEGIRVPRPINLAKGSTLIRFANSTAGQDRWAISPWWIREADFRQVEEAQQHSLAVHGQDTRRALTLGFIGKQALAIKQRWSADAPANLVDVVVVCETLRDVPAFVGRGTTQYETAPNGFRLTWTGWSSVDQIFIPELARKRGALIGPSSGQPLLRMIRSTQVSSQQLF